MTPQTQTLLIGESFSPWTKKARWALEYGGIAYDYQEYTPTLSEPGLRWRLRQWTGTVSVPMLFADHKVFRGSWKIARYVDARAGCGELGDLDEIAPFNDLSEAALAEGRARVVRCILSNNQALKESLPAFVPVALRTPLTFVARDAVRRLDRKYAHLVEPGALRQALVATREGLARSDSDYLLDRFSYADIAMAVTLEVVAPIANAQPPLGPSTQRCWNDLALAKEFEDLLNWRDRIAANVETSYSQFKLDQPPMKT